MLTSLRTTYGRLHKQEVDFWSESLSGLLPSSSKQIRTSSHVWVTNDEWQGVEKRLVRRSRGKLEGCILHLVLRGYRVDPPHPPKHITTSMRTEARPPGRMLIRRLVSSCARSCEIAAILGIADLRVALH